VVICPYVTSLERACGRASTHGDYCGFHAILFLYETDSRPPTVSRIVALVESARPLMEVRS
jgi:hypothetical protein